MKMKRVLALFLSFLLILNSFGTVAFADTKNAVAKVGNTEYATIDEAISNWTNNTTLTLLADVTLSDVIKLSSTEYHILDLGTYTMTAAKNKDAIQYVVNGRSSAGYALDIKADATNPGGITATSGSVVRHTKPLISAPSKDRPITRFYGGVFNASYVVRQGGTLGAGYTGASAPYFYFYGGEFNGTIYTNRSQNQFYGGTFNGSMSMSVDTSAYTLIAGGTFKNLSNSMGSALNSDKFTIGSAKGVYDKEVYIDNNGNTVIAAAEPAEGIEAAVAKTPGTNDYLAYSKVATEGALNYTDVYTALEKNKTATVTVYADEVDLTNSSFKGTIVVPEDEEMTIVVAEGATPAWTIKSAVENEEPNVTYEDINGNELVKSDSGAFEEPTPSVKVDGAVDVEIQPIAGVENSYNISLKEGSSWNEGNSVEMTFPAVEGAADGDMAYVVHEHEDGKYIYVGEVKDGSITITNNVGFSTFTVNAGGLNEALADAKAMTGDVTVEIYDKVTLDTSLAGSYSSINFVGKDDDAEIYIDLQGYVDAPQKDVSFKDLKLSKVAGGHIANAGFMNLAFGVYSAKSVSYTNCIFVNGAYASFGTNTFTDCTFYKSHDRYGMWAYGSNDIVVDGCTFADIRGIKMYDEGGLKTTVLTVKNTDFSAVTDKPAIVLTYGASVNIEGNKYPAKGTFELDLDGAPNGTPVSGSDAEKAVCINDNGVCGVLVDGKIYTTVAQAAEAATEGSTVTLLHNSTETVEFAEGVGLDKNGFEANGVTVKKSYVAQIGEISFESFADAIEAAKSGDEIILLADVSVTSAAMDDVHLNGNGYKLTVEDTLVFSDGNMTVANIDGPGKIIFGGAVNFYGTNSVIPAEVKGAFELIVNKGATLLISRFVLGYNRNITVYGEIEDAHSFDPTGKTPSLKFNSTSGVSVGGTDKGNLKVENAYVELGNSSWKNANGTYNWSFKNSYVSAPSFTNNNPRGTEAAEWTVTFDNSVLAAKNYIKNGVGTTYNFTNGSVAKTGSLRIDGVMNIDATSSVSTTLQQNNKVGEVDEHGGINGIVNVNGELNIASNSKTALEVLDGTVNIGSSGKLSLGSNSLTLDADSKLIIDASGMTTGAYSGIEGSVTNNGTIEVANNDKVTTEIQDGKLVLVEKPVTISTADELIAFAKDVNENGNTYAGKYVVLADDIDLAGSETNLWTPIGASGDSEPKFRGTFDGQGHTISNLYVKQGAAYHAAGLFGATNGTIKNLTIDGAYVESLSSGSATVNGTAVVAGSTAYGATIDDVHVKNATVKGNRYVAGIVGYMDGTVTNCSIENVTFIATPDDIDGNGVYDNGDKVGGIVGYTNSGATEISGCELKGEVNITGYRDMGGLVGTVQSSVVVGENVNNAKVTITVDQVTYFYEKKAANANEFIGRGTASATSPENTRGQDATFETVIVEPFVAEVNGVGYATLADAVANIAKDGSDTTIELLCDIEVDASIEFNYGKGDIIFTADTPVVVKQTKLGTDFAFTKGEQNKIIIDENVTFEIYDNSSGMYVYYGPSVEIKGAVTGGQNWGVLYLYNGTHTVTETGSIGVGRIQAGYSETTVKGTVDTNYLLVEGSTFTADGAVVDANVIYDNNNGGQRWGASTFNVKNNSEIITSKLTISYADTKFNIDLSSRLTAGTIVGAGTISIDATAFNGTDVQVIKADMSGFTGKVEITGNDKADYEITETGIVVIAAAPAEEKLDTRLGYVRGLKTTNEDGIEKYQAYLFGGIDSLNYQNVGYQVTFRNQTKTQVTKTVYTYVNAANGVFYPKNFGDNCEYIIALEVLFPIDDNSKDEDFIYRVFATKQNGDIIYSDYLTVDAVYNK